MVQYNPCKEVYLQQRIPVRAAVARVNNSACTTRSVNAGHLVISFLALYPFVVFGHDFEDRRICVVGSAELYGTWSTATIPD